MPRPLKKRKTIDFDSSGSSDDDDDISYQSAGVSSLVLSGRTSSSSSSSEERTLDSESSPSDLAATSQQLFFSSDDVSPPSGGFGTQASGTTAANVPVNAAGTRNRSSRSDTSSIPMDSLASAAPILKLHKAPMSHQKKRTSITKKSATNKASLANQDARPIFVEDLTHLDDDDEEEEASKSSSSLPTTKTNNNAPKNANQKRESPRLSGAKRSIDVDSAKTQILEKKKKAKVAADKPATVATDCKVASSDSIAAKATSKSTKNTPKSNKKTDSSPVPSNNNKAKATATTNSTADKKLPSAKSKPKTTSPKASNNKKAPPTGATNKKLARSECGASSKEKKSVDTLKTASKSPPSKTAKSGDNTTNTSTDRTREKNSAPEKPNPTKERTSVKEKTTSAKKSSSNPTSSAKVKGSISSTTDPKSKTLPSDKENSAHSPPPKKKKRKLTFQDQVFQHMMLSYKPFTLKSLAADLKTTESSLNFLMLSLVDKNLVIKKEFTSSKGRTKELYWVNYDAKSKEITNALATPSEIRETKQEHDQLQDKLDSLNKVLSGIMQVPSNAELAKQLEEKESELSTVRQRIQGIKERISQQKEAEEKQKAMLTSRGASTAQVTKQNCPRRLKVRINNMRDEWKKRKEKCNDFIEQLADGLEKKPKDIVKLLDLETDEMMGAALPAKYVIED